MNSIYLDTNIIIYHSYKDSPFYTSSSKLIQHCQKLKIPLVTSTETIQEIMFFTQRTNQLQKGINICTQALKIVKTLPISSQTIVIYLALLQKHPKIISRDALHLASCLENDIQTFATYDKELLAYDIINTCLPEKIISH